MLKEYTIDLSEAPDTLEADIEANEEAEETLLEKVNERFPPDEDSPEAFGFQHPDCPADYEEKFYELREERAELQSRRARIEEFLTEEDQAGEWSHYRFTFQEPSTEDALFIQGRSQALAEESERRGKKVDGRVFGVSQLLERVRRDAPPEAPDDLSSGLPNQVGEWLLDELNARTTSGVSEELGNTSPQEALRSFRSSRPS